MFMKPVLALRYIIAQFTFVGSDSQAIKSKPGMRGAHPLHVRPMAARERRPAEQECKAPARPDGTVTLQSVGGRGLNALARAIFCIRAGAESPLSRIPWLSRTPVPNARYTAPPSSRLIPLFGRDTGPARTHTAPTRAVSSSASAPAAPVPAAAVAMCPDAQVAM